MHRFDKASYFYVYYNTTRQSARIEVANNAGTTDQDAFSGYLDQCRVINSHRFPTLVTLVVDAAASSAGSPTSRAGKDPDEWRLASNDPRDTGRTKYRIHTLDIYFWAQEDSKSVLDTFNSLLDPSQLDVAELEPEEESPHERQQDSISPAVQNLEHVALSDPSYQNGQTRDSRGQPQHQQQQQQQPVIIPPPPIPHQQHLTPQPYQSTSSVSPVSAMSRSQSDIKPIQGQEPTQTFAPIPYNPAAPAAPEPIAHREDTPPPPDDGVGLASAVHDNPTAYGRSPSQQWTGVPQPGHQPYQVGQSPAHSQSYGSPPPPSGPTSFSGSTLQPGSAGAGSRHDSTAAQHYVPGPPQSQAQMYNPQPAETPGAQFYSTNPHQAHKPLQHIQPQYPDYLSHNSQSSPPPTGGYSQYNYMQAQQQQQQQPQSHQQHAGGNPYDVHGQVYRPTAAEHAQHHRKSNRASTNSGKPPSKWEARAEKVEKRGGNFLKKLGI